MLGFESGLTAFVICFREGMEVLLILFAVYSITGRPALPIVLGAAAGVGVNVLLGLIIGFSGLQNAIADKAIMLLAAALMLYVARGLILWRLTGEDKKNRLEQLAYQTMGNAVSVFALTAFVIGREMFELLLFMQALSIRSGGWSELIFTGIGLAALCLVALYFTVDRISKVVPLWIIFAVSSAWLIAQAGILIWEVLQ
jgi:high-affinity Fe2+/Pb2+ permease